MRRALQLQEDSLSATLLFAQHHFLDGPDGLPRISDAMWGDGVSVEKHRSGDIYIRETNFVSPNRVTGAPYYLRYDLDPDLYHRYKKEFGWQESSGEYYYTKVVDTMTHIDANGVVDTYNDEGAYNPEEEYKHHVMHQDGDLEFVALMSDGVSSFYETTIGDTGKVNKPVPTLDIVQELISFKTLKGSFVQRRCNKAFKTFAKKGWHNADDVSIAVMAFD
jgi:hypothetical protein